MKANELADALQKLAHALKQIPDIEINELRNLLAHGRNVPKENIAVNLSTLAALSHLDKTKWAEFVSSYNIPIEIRPRDASRDILGKLLKYLEENPEARRRLRERAERKEATASPELMRAFSLLLADPINEEPSGRD